MMDLKIKQRPSALLSRNRSWLYVIPLICLVLPTVSAAMGSNGIEAALRATLSQHPALTGERANIEAKSYMGDSARAARYPSITAQASIQHTNNYPVGIRARQPLWAFGRIDNGIAYADADMKVETIALLKMKRQLIDETAVAYARVLGTRERLEVAVNNELALEVFYQQIKRREVGQLASIADVRLALARKLQAQARKSRLNSDVLVAENELLALTQSPVASTQMVSAALTQLPSQEEVMLLAQERSADIRFKSENIALAKADVDRERSAPMPTIYLQGDYFYNDQAAGTSDFRIGVAIEANLEGMGFAAYGRNNAAGARLQAVNADLKATLTEVRRNVTSLYTNRQAQETIVASQIHSVAELSEILDSYQRQYDAGQKPWLEVLNMQRELNEQLHQLAQSKNDWLIYTLKLLAMTGSLDTLAGEVDQTEDPAQEAE